MNGQDGAIATEPRRPGRERDGAVGVTMFGRCVSAELLKLAKRPAMWVVAAVWIVLSLVFGYAFPYFSYLGGFTGQVNGPDPELVLAEALPEQLVPAAIQGFPMFAGALALILGGLAAGSEYQWQTLKTVLTQGPPRWLVLAARLATLGLVTGGLVLVTFAVDVVASWLVATVTAHPVRWPAVADVLAGAGAGWLIVLMWCFAGVFLGTLARGTAMAIGIGLVWALAVENLVRIFAAILPVMETVQLWTPGTNAGGLAAAFGVPPQGQAGGTPGVTTAVDGPQAAIVLGIYILIFAVAAGALLQRRDVI